LQYATTDHTSDPNLKAVWIDLWFYEHDNTIMLSSI
jgi:hypothetical protein